MYWCVCMCARTHISQSSGPQRRNKPCRKQGSSCRGCRTTAVHFKWLYDPFPHVRAITNDTLMQVSLLQSARRLKNVLSVMYLSDDYLLELWRTFTNYSAASIATAPLIPIKQQRTRRLWHFESVNTRCCWGETCCFAPTLFGAFHSTSRWQTISFPLCDQISIDFC